MAKRADRFVVGYLGKGQYVYGLDIDDEARWSFPMTIAKAKKAIKNFSGPSNTVVIYELVEVSRHEIKD